MTDDPIARYNQRLAEVNAAHLRGEETAADKRLNDAREGSQKSVEILTRCNDDAIPVRANRDSSFDQPQGVIVRTPDELMGRAMDYWINGAIPDSRIGPPLPGQRMSRVGLEIPRQAALMVEETIGFEKVRLYLWLSYRRPQHAPAIVPTPPALNDFLSELALQLPYEFLPPGQQWCEAEYIAALVAEEARANAAIDEKYRKRYPGLIR